MNEIWKAVAVATVTGLLTLAGVMSTSVMGWWSSSQSSEVTARQSCISRLDNQEQSFRLKADLFLVSMGSFVSLSGHTKFTLEDYDARLDELMKAGYAFSAYAPAKLSDLSRNMVNNLKSSIKESDDQKSLKLVKAYNENYEKWSSLFQDALIQIEADRKEC
jgi:hypothetical protein